MQVVDDERRILLILGPFVCGWVSEWVRACMRLSVALYLVDMIASKVFVKSISNFTWNLRMMRGGTLLILGHRVKGQGQLWHSVYKTLWTGYRQQLLQKHFQTSHVSCGWWEEEPYWFWVTGSKVKVNFGTLCIRPCGQDTDYSFVSSHFQTTHVGCGWWGEEPYWFWVTGSKVKVNIGTLCIRPCGHDTDYSFCPIFFKLHM